jgi:peptidoglycan hydrolase-like protein with peptidoglycan-binding domain
MMAGEPELRRGDSGEWVQYLQRLLVNAGHSPGAIDGEFGDSTEQVVAQVQSTYGLEADGVVGSVTWALLTGSPSEGDDTTGGDASGDVPPELVEAGAPAQLAQWSEEQKHAYFVGEQQDEFGGDAPESLEAAVIEASDDEGSLA